MLTAVLIAALTTTPGDRWPAFRGDGTSLSAATKLPTEWSDTTNLAWSVPIPGYGQSSPVVWGDRVFVTSTDGEDKDRLLVSCFAMTTGEKLWTKEFAGTQKVKVSDYVSRGAPTPAVDAERVYAFFESGDLVALSHAGEKLWQRSFVKDYGEFQGNHGIGASIAATDDSVIALIDHSGPSYLVAINKATGENLWKVERESKVSWSSPIVRTRDGQPEVVISSNGFVDCYAAKTGERLWWLSGLDGNTVASPALLDNLVLIGSSKANENVAVTADGEGDVTATAVKWRAADATSSFGSPLVTHGVAYYVNRSGVLFAVDPASGATLWNERLPDSCWASPIAADGKVYLFTKGGTTVVMQAGPEQKRLAENALTAEGRIYGAAAVDGAFLIRSGNRLWKIGETSRTP